MSRQKQAFEEYINLWNDKKFTNMYDYLSEHAKKTISKKEFTEKYQKIYEGIGVKNLKIKTKGEKILKIKNFFFLKLIWIRMEEQFHSSMKQNS